MNWKALFITVGIFLALGLLLLMVDLMPKVVFAMAVLGFVWIVYAAVCDCLEYSGEK